MFWIILSVKSGKIDGNFLFFVQISDFSKRGKSRLPEEFFSGILRKIIKGKA